MRKKANQAVTVFVVSVSMFMSEGLIAQTNETGQPYKNRPQHEIAADFRSGDSTRLSRAIAEVYHRIPDSLWTYDLRGAILQAIPVEFATKSLGKDPHNGRIGLGELAGRIARLGDARAAPVAFHYGGSGISTREDLLFLGKAGFDVVLEFAAATSPAADETYCDYRKALGTLELFLYDKGVDTFDAAMLSKIRGVVGRVLKGPTHPIVLSGGEAICLALMLGDRELEAVARMFAADTSAIRGRLAFSPRPGYGHSTEMVLRIQGQAIRLLSTPKPIPWFRTSEGGGGSRSK